MVLLRKVLLVVQAHLLKDLKQLKVVKVMPTQVQRVHREILTKDL